VDGDLAAGLLGQDDAFGAALSRHAAGLDEWLPGGVSGDVVAAVDRAFGAAGIGLPDSEPTDAERDAIRAVVTEGRTTG